MAGEGRLDGTTALVTGGSRGIGFACARALAGQGARVALLARNAEGVRTSARAIGDDVVHVACDLTIPDDVERAIAAVRRELGAAPDIIVNSAGQLLLAPIEGTPVAEFDRILLVNLTAPFAFIREFVPELKTRGSGHVVTIGSLADRVGLPGNAAYAASKFGLRGLHEVLRDELRGSGVRVTLVSPEHVATGIWESVPAEQRPSGTRPTMLAAENVADAVLFAVTAPAAMNVDELRISHA